MMRVGWIGLGKMGMPMASNLMKAGYELKAYNRTIEKAKELEPKGAQVAATVVEAAQDSDVVISMVSNDAVLEAVSIGDDGAFQVMPAGSVFIDMSTVSPNLSQKIALAAKEQGIHYLRAPVSGSTALAEAATLTIMASGPEASYNQCLPLFEAMGQRIFHVGEAEQARFLKLAINMMVGMTAGMMGEALAFGEKGGLDWQQMLEIIGSSAVASPLVGYKVEPLKKRDFTPAFPASMMAKDFDLALDAAKSEGAPMPFTALMRQYWSVMESTGKGELDFFAYVTLAEELAGLSND